LVPLGDQMVATSIYGGLIYLVLAPPGCGSAHLLPTNWWARRRITSDETGDRLRLLDMKRGDIGGFPRNADGRSRISMQADAAAKMEALFTLAV